MFKGLNLLYLVVGLLLNTKRFKISTERFKTRTVV
jgi:hypothetical protein